MVKVHFENLGGMVMAKICYYVQDEYVPGQLWPASLMYLKRLVYCQVLFWHNFSTRDSYACALDSGAKKQNVQTFVLVFSHIHSVKTCVFFKVTLRMNIMLQVDSHFCWSQWPNFHSPG